LTSATTEPTIDPLVSLYSLAISLHMNRNSYKGTAFMHSHYRTARFCALLVSLALIAGTSMAAVKTSTGTGDWDAGGTWTGGTVPGDTDDVYICSGHTVTINGINTININSLTITGVLRHADNSTTEANKIILSITNDCTVVTGGKIDVSALGYNSGQGPGYGGSGTRGGSHGGRGWSNHGTLYGETYGSITSPTNCGSGGQNTAGGGAVILAVEGETKVYGYIKANSGSGGNWQYTGSGGSVFLTTSNLVGTGTIEARSVSTHFSGGGGRIAVVLTGTDSFGSVDMITYASQDVTGDGAAGTVYLEKQSDTTGQGELVLNQNNYLGNGAWAVTAMSDAESKSYQFSRVTATNSGALVVGSDDSINLTGATLAGDADGTCGVIVDGGTLTVGSTWTLTGLMVAIRAGSTFDVSSALTVGSGGTLAIDSSHTISGDVTVQSGGTLTHSANSSTEAYKMDLTIGGNLQVDAGGKVDVDLKGYSTGNGPGYKVYCASHGGSGYNNRSPTYGSIVSPTNCGSGAYSSAGGGAAILTVTEDIKLYGFITASAAYAGSWKYPGAGGSVFLTTSNLVGTGTIKASSGLPSGHFSGGGGRIAVHLTGAGSTFGSVDMIAYPEDSSYDSGAGTVYKRTASQGLNEGTLIIDNPVNSSYYTTITSLVSDASVGGVIIKNNGKLKLEDGELLQVSRIWSNDNVFLADPGSRVKLTGTDTATIYGNSTFEELVCTGVSKTINFEAGATTDVDDNFTFTGLSDTSLVLRSTAPGTQWLLDVDAGATVLSVSYVDAEDSDARPGQSITASFSEDTGNNSNWVFAATGQTNWWIGGVSANWGDNGNWSLGRPPAGIDGGTIISNNCTTYPSLPSDQVLQYFEMKNPSSLWLDGFDLTVEGEAVIAGTLTATGTVTLTFKDDVNFTSGTFTQGMSMVLLAGTGAQSMTSDSESCYRLTVTNSGRTVTFTDMAVATYFRNESVNIAFVNGFWVTEFRTYATTIGTPVALQFGQYTTSTMTDLYVLGSAGASNRLEVGGGGDWFRFTPTRIAYVKHALVSDCRNDVGPLTIYAIDSDDEGSNVGWVFNANWLTWNGVASSDFTASGNWTPASSPDATARCNIDGNGGNAPVLSTSYAVKELFLGLDETSSLTLNGELTVGENLRVGGLGTLTANQPATISNDVTVINGGVLTHTDNTTTEANKIDLTVGGDFVLQSGAEIDVDDRGYQSSAGPGEGNYGRGGSHGGEGGWVENADDRNTYGSIMAPTNSGSGGSNGDGGGAVKLTVSGQTKLYGYVSADGEEWGGSYASAGSGGSIFLTTGTLVGNGTLEAEGGRAHPYPAGGGGRISVVLTSGTSFDQVAMKVRGGEGNTSQAYNGANGTIYKQIGTDAAGAGTVIVDCDGRGPDSTAKDASTILPPDTMYVADELASATLIITNDNTRFRLSGDLYVAELLIYTNTVVTLNNNTNLYVDVVEHHLNDVSQGGMGGPTNSVDTYASIIWKLPPPGAVFLLK